MSKFTYRRWAQLGVVGPTVFVGAWLVGSLRAADYSVVDDAISQLAASGAETRSVMTLGLVVYGAALIGFGVLGRATIGRNPAVAAIVTGVATLGVAATPLDTSSIVDQLHGIAAVIGYVSLVALPVSLIPTLRRLRLTRLAYIAPHTSIIATLALLFSMDASTNGLWQRIGLTIVDVWLILVSAALLTARESKTHVETPH